MNMKGQTDLNSLFAVEAAKNHLIQPTNFAKLQFKNNHWVDEKKYLGSHKTPSLYNLDQLRTV